MDELCKALGWQGGTIHQVIEEVKFLKSGVNNIDSELTKVYKLINFTTEDAYNEDIRQARKKICDISASVRKKQSPVNGGYSLEDMKKFTLAFFRHWYNTTGTNTEDAFDEWYEKVGKDILPTLPKEQTSTIVWPSEQPYFNMMRGMNMAPDEMTYGGYEFIIKDFYTWLKEQTQSLNTKTEEK